MYSLPADPPAFFGPLPVKVQTSLSGVATLLEPERVATLPSGAREQRLRLDIGNNAVYHGEVTRFIYDDSEIQNLRLGEAYGQAWGEWSWQASLVQRTGGFLDPLIRVWHQNVVPFTDSVFSKIPNGQVRSEVRDGATVFLDGGSAAALTSVTLSARRPVRPGVSARAVVKLPVRGREALLDNGAVDLGIGLLGETRLTPRWSAHANLNLVRAGATQVGTLTQGQRWLTGSVVAAEFQSTPRINLVVQMEDTSFPFNRGLRGRSSRRQQMSFGIWHQADAKTRCYASIAENIYPFLVTSYTPDVMLSLGVVRRR